MPANLAAVRHLQAHGCIFYAQSRATQSLESRIVTDNLHLFSAGIPRADYESKYNELERDLIGKLFVDPNRSSRDKAFLKFDLSNIGGGEIIIDDTDEIARTLCVSVEQANEFRRLVNATINEATLTRLKKSLSSSRMRDFDFNKLVRANFPELAQTVAQWNGLKLDNYYLTSTGKWLAHAYRRALRLRTQHA